VLANEKKVPGKSEVRFSALALARGGISLHAHRRSIGADSEGDAREVKIDSTFERRAGIRPLIGARSKLR
jgi:hypothetical protein